MTKVMGFGVEGGFEHRENRLFHFCLGIPVMCRYDRELKLITCNKKFIFILFLQKSVLT